MTIRAGGLVDAADLSLIANPPRCSVYMTTAAAIATGTPTALTWDTEEYDTDGMHSTTTNTSRITCVTPGLYLLTSNIEWSAFNAGYIRLQFRINGVTYTAANVAPFITATGQLAIATQYQLVAGDYVEVIATQSIVASKAPQAGAGTTTFKALRLCA